MSSSSSSPPSTTWPSKTSALCHFVILSDGKSLWKEGVQLMNWKKESSRERERLKQRYRTQREKGKTNKKQNAPNISLLSRLLAIWVLSLAHLNLKLLLSHLNQNGEIPKLVPSLRGHYEVWAPSLQVHFTILTHLFCTNHHISHITTLSYRYILISSYPHILTPLSSDPPS